MQSESLSNTLDSNFNWVIPQNIFVCMDISYATSNGRKNVRNLNIFPPPRNAFVFYYKMYLSQIALYICLKFQNIFVCNDMQCNLSWDGRENVRNFNIFPPLKNASRILLQIQRKIMKISKENKNSELENISCFQPSILSFYFFQILYPPQPTTYLFWLSSAYRPVSDLKAKHQKRRK